jgi:hypothetical protein
MGNGSLPRAKRPGHDVNKLPPSRPEVKDRIELYIYSPLWAFVKFTPTESFVKIDRIKLLHFYALFLEDEYKIDGPKDRQRTRT